MVLKVYGHKACPCKNKEGLIEGKDISRVLVKLKKTD